MAVRNKSIGLFVNNKRETHGSPLASSSGRPSASMGVMFPITRILGR